MSRGGALGEWEANAAPDTIIGKLRDERRAMTNQVIPAEAVEAAMRAFDPSWDMVPTEWRDYFLRRTRAALEAAAPHMLAVAWDEGVEAKSEHPDPTNPYKPTP